MGGIPQWSSEEQEKSPTEEESTAEVCDKLPATSVPLEWRRKRKLGVVTLGKKGG